MNRHNKPAAKNQTNQTQSKQQQLQQSPEQMSNQQVYTLQVIDEDGSQIEGDGDLSDYLTQGNIITTGKPFRIRFKLQL